VPEREGRTTRRRLNELTQAISDELLAIDEAGRQAAAHAHRCGELLIEAQTEVEQTGEPWDWLRVRGVSARLARHYTHLAQSRAELFAGGVERSTRLRSRLHARPSARLATLAKAFKSEIAVRGAAAWVDAKSSSAVLGLRLQGGTTIHFRASGIDANEAIEALIGLVCACEMEA
jgi:phosphocarrier protein HPr